jgi:hypothetical protein
MIVFSIGAAGAADIRRAGRPDAGLDPFALAAVWYDAGRRPRHRRQRRRRRLLWLGQRVSGGSVPGASAGASASRRRLADRSSATGTKAGSPPSSTT